jgi:hypothetical protein
MQRNVILCEIIVFVVEILWRMDPFLGKDLETSNKTTAVAMQRRGKHTSTTVELLLCKPLLRSCNIWTTTVEREYFTLLRAEGL